MKSNAERNRKTIESISGKERRVDASEAALVLKSYEVTILMDISVSLASIADSLERGEKE